MTENSNSCFAIIQARMTSKRLPGKVLMEFAGQPALAHLVDRLSRAPGLKGIAVATTTNQTDDPVAALADKLNVQCFRGDEFDVLARFSGAAAQVNAQTIVRVTGDCPLIDPAVVSRVISAFNASDADYAANNLERSYPIGQDTEVFSRASLDQAARFARRDDEREHVTPYIRRRPETYRQINVAAPPWQHDPLLRLTLDTHDDFMLIEDVFRALYPRNNTFDLDDILSYIAANPAVRALNDHVVHNWITAK